MMKLTKSAWKTRMKVSNVLSKFTKTFDPASRKKRYFKERDPHSSRWVSKCIPFVIPAARPFPHINAIKNYKTTSKKFFDKTSDAFFVARNSRHQRKKKRSQVCKCRAVLIYQMGSAIRPYFRSITATIYNDCLFFCNDCYTKAAPNFS